MKKKTSALNLQPTAGYVLIEPAETTKQTSGGIYLPDTHDEKPQQGIILAVGDEPTCCCNCCGDSQKTHSTSLRVKRGDKVIYKKWGGNEVKVDGKEYLFSKFEDILAIVN